MPERTHSGARLRTPLLRCMAALTVAFLLAAQSPGQSCAVQWAPDDGSLGVDGAARAQVMWDPDGPGPLTPVIVIAGQFNYGGNVPARNIVTFDPATQRWAALGSGLGSTTEYVSTLALLPNASGGADLIAGGRFLQAGGTQVNSIARWDGAAWRAIGPGFVYNGLYGEVNALAVRTRPTGGSRLIAGGYIDHAGARALHSLAEWDGAAWNDIGAGLIGPVRVIAAPPGFQTYQEMYVGGRLFAPVGNLMDFVARWNGTQWAVAGSGINGQVNAATVLPDGAGGYDMIAVGGYQHIGDAPIAGVARLHGDVWTQVGTPVAAQLSSVAVTSAGDLLVGGMYSSIGSLTVNGIARWNGAAWSALGQGVGSGSADSILVAPSPQGVETFYIAGGFQFAGGKTVQNAARWAAGVWSPYGRGFDNQMKALKATSGGTVIAGGSFRNAGNAPVNYIARWNGTDWSAMGAGLNGEVDAIEQLPNGDIVAGGYFSVATGGLNYIARWNGSAWLPLVNGLNGPVRALAVMPSGDLIVGGAFSNAGPVSIPMIARWNGSAWSSINTSNNGGVSALAVTPGGELIAGGHFAVIGGVTASNIARWNGSTWSPLGAGTNDDVTALAVDPDGNVIAGGNFTQAGGIAAARIARWDGTAWSAMGSGFNGTVQSIRVLPNAHAPHTVVAGGSYYYAAPTPATYLARWDGTAWSTPDGGVTGNVYALDVRDDGAGNRDVFVGGSMRASGASSPATFAHWRQPTPVPGQVQAPATVACDATSFSASLPGAQDPVRWQAFQDGVWTDLSDGPVGAPAKFVASGAASPALALSQIDWPRLNGKVVIRAVVQGVCSNAATPSKSVAHIIADLGSTGGAPGADSQLDNNDFIVFIDYFFSADTRADLGSQGGAFGPDGVFDNNDFIVYIDQFFAGC